MILQASYNEINGFIRKKSGHYVHISYKDIDTLKITVTASDRGDLTGLLSKILEKTFSADLHLIGIHGSTMTVDVDAGRLGSLVLNHAKSFLLSSAPKGLVESFDGRRAVLNLTAIPQAKAILDNLIINNLTVAENAVYVVAAMKE